MTKVSNLLARWVAYELARAGFRWDKPSARYRDNATGRYVSEQHVRETVEAFNLDAHRDNVTNLTQQLIDKKISLPDWQQAMAQEIKDAHIVNASAGRGGRNAMTQEDWGRTGGRLTNEYNHLNSFADDIATGNMSDAQIMARANSYSGASRKAYYDGMTAAAADAGFTEERRLLQPGESCGDCIAFEAKGWQPVGSLPEPGQDSQCLSNCNCIKEYR